MTSSSPAQDENWGWLRALWNRGWFLGLLLVATIIFVYQPVWHAGFIWDDDAHVTKPALRSLGGLASIWIRLGATQQYYPLVHSVFWVEHKLWGDSTVGYHLTNILLHAFSALLLVKILRQLKIPGAWLAAAIFALHPVQVESVAWISELKNTLSGAFYLGSALAYLGFDRNRSGGNYALALGLFVLGLMSKTVIATLPAALLVVFWWQRGKISWKQDVLPLIPFFVAGIGAGLFTAWVERKYIGAEGSEFNFSIVERFLIAGRVTWFYLGKLFWPVNLVFVYPRWNVSQGVWWQYLYPGAALLLLGALCWQRRRWRGPLAGLLFFGGTLFPALGFFNVYPFRFSLVADHFQYLAGIGPIVLAAGGIATALGKWCREKPFLKPVLCGVLLLTLGVLTWRQCGMYASLETLWGTTVARNPNSFLAHNNLGNVFFRNGRMDEAIGQYQKALVIQPRYALALNNLGNVFLRNGRVDEAIEQYQKALAIQPGDADTHDNLGKALLKKGQVDEAIVHFQQALAIQPDDGATHDYLGNGLLKKGQVDEALVHFQKALALQPDNADFHNNFGNALLGKGKLDEAITHYQKALEIRPVSAEFHNNLGTVLLWKGQVDEAMVHFQKAVEIQPDYAKAHEGLGMVFFQKAQVDEAIVHFQEVLKIHPDFAEANHNLGAAFLQKGQMNEAIAYYQKAVQLEPLNAEFQSNLGYALFLRGEVREAIAHYQTSLEIQPQNAITCKNLAWILATCPEASVRNGAKAVKLAEQAARLSGSPDPIFIGTLAAAYAEAGRFSEAIATAQRAQQLALDQSNPDLVNALQGQIGLYQAGSPFRDTSQTNTPDRSQ
jgi:tetratricopeptide (TPR) repeat protein